PEIPQTMSTARAITNAPEVPVAFVALSENRSRIKPSPALFLRAIGNTLSSWLSGSWIAGLSLLGRGILLSSRSHAVNDRDADQTEHAHSDPFLRHVQHVGTDRHADDEDDVTGDVNPE